MPRERNIFAVELEGQAVRRHFPWSHRTNFHMIYHRVVKIPNELLESGWNEDAQALAKETQTTTHTLEDLYDTMQPLHQQRPSSPVASH